MVHFQQIEGYPICINGGDRAAVLVLLLSVTIQMVLLARTALREKLLDTFVIVHAFSVNRPMNAAIVFFRPYNYRKKHSMLSVIDEISSLQSVAHGRAWRHPMPNGADSGRIVPAV